MPPTLRICMLNADVPVPAVHSTIAQTYGRIFHNLLASASSQQSPTTAILSTDYNVVNGEYPPSIDDFDAVIISGSANSAYDDLPWIKQLDHYVRDVYYKHPRIKIFGSCFGHQITCHSLLGEYEVKVEKDPQGWEIGVQTITLHHRFREVFGEMSRLGGSVVETLRLQFVHHDHVVVPHELPAGWMTVGSTKHCAIQGMYQPGRILTTQGHFEFDRVVNRDTVKYFFPDWAPEVLEKALDAIDKDDDSVVAAGMILSFLQEESNTTENVDQIGLHESQARTVHGTCRDECEPSEQTSTTVVVP